MMTSKLKFPPRKSRNVVIAGVRTCIGLEPAMWAGLEDIARRENLTATALIERIEDCRRRDPAMRNLAEDTQGSRLTPAIRVFLMTYYRQLAESGGQRSPLDELLGRPPARKRIFYRPLREKRPSS